MTAEHHLVLGSRYASVPVVKVPVPVPSLIPGRSDPTGAGSTAEPGVSYHRGTIAESRPASSLVTSRPSLSPASRLTSIPRALSPTKSAMTRVPALSPEQTRDNVLADFPPDQFSIAVTCDHCGHGVWLDRSTVPEAVTIPSLRSRLRCTACGRRGASIRIVYVAAGGFRVGSGTPVHPVQDTDDQPGQ